MYTFWVVVIGFAMLTLIMIYTYQFDGFKEYWEKYFKIPLELYDRVQHSQIRRTKIVIFVFQANGYRSGTVPNQRFILKLGLSDIGRHNNSCTVANFPQKIFGSFGCADESKVIYFKFLCRFSHFIFVNLMSRDVAL